MDAAEFKTRVMPMSRKLLHYAYQMLHDSAEAEDTIQEVVLKLWNIRHSLNDIRNPEAFAMTMTRNWCLDRLKAKKPLYVGGYQQGYDRQSDDADPHKRMEHEDRVKMLRRIIEGLPDQQKQVIQLRDIEELEYEQIAEIMDMNLNALRVTLSRARSRIREEIVKLDAHGYQTNKNTAGKVL